MTSCCQMCGLVLQLRGVVWVAVALTDDSDGRVCPLTSEDHVPGEVRS